VLSITKVQHDKIQVISKFLNPNKIDIDKIDDLEPLLTLPPYAFKFFDEKDINLIQQLFNFSTIEEFSSLNPLEPFEAFNFVDEYRTRMDAILKENPRFKEKIKKAIIISFLMKSLTERDLNLEKKKQKILVIGLDNAGKTALISKLGGHFSINDLASLKPTKGMDRQEIKTKEMNLIIWDFGGHKLYRDRHLSNEENLIGADLLIYVIDVQDSAKFDESINYFKNIVELLYKIEENPQIIVLIHKFDPDVANNPEISLNIEFLIDEITNIFDNKNFDFEIFLSSIYSTFSKEPKLSKLIKDLINDPESFIYESETSWNKIKIVGETVKKILNAVIKLSEYCNALDNRIVTLENAKKTPQQLTPYSPAQNMVQNQPLTNPSLNPPEASPVQLNPPSGNPINEQVRRARAKDAIMSELKEVFAKRRDSI